MYNLLEKSKIKDYYKIYWHMLRYPFLTSFSNILITHLPNLYITNILFQTVLSLTVRSKNQKNVEWEDDIKAIIKFDVIP